MSSDQPPPPGGTPPPTGGTPPPPPPPGGWPPPPPAHGAGGPPPGQYGYGYAQPFPERRWNLGEALGYGWTKFQQNAGQIVLAALVLLVAMGVVFGIGFGIIGALTSQNCSFDAVGNYRCTGGVGFLGSLVLNALLSAVLLVVTQLVGAGVIRGALGITDGRPFRVGDVFRTDHLGPVLVASVIIAAATFVGTLLCYLPGLVVGFATSYTLYFVLDQDLSPVDAIKASVTLVKDNLGDTLIWYVVGGLVAALGFVLCFVGALVSVPVVLIGTAYTYRRLTDRPVAP